MTVSPQLDERFRAAAAAEGLLDVAYDVDRLSDRAAPGRRHRARSVPHLVRRRPRARSSIRSAEPSAPASSALRARWTRSSASSTSTSPASRRSFDLKVDLERLTPFNRTVLEQLARVPYGSLTTYGALAGEAGRPRAARAVGMVMNRNPIPIVLPCHRVVGSTGSLVGYAGGLERKETLLKLEGALLVGPE